MCASVVVEIIEHHIAQEVEPAEEGPPHVCVITFVWVGRLSLCAFSCLLSEQLLTFVVFPCTLS